MKIELNIRNSSNTGWINLLDSSIVKIDDAYFSGEKSLSSASNYLRSCIEYLTTNKPKNVYEVTDITALTDLPKFSPINIVTNVDGENMIEKSDGITFDGIVLSDVLANEKTNILLRNGSIS